MKERKELKIELGFETGSKQIIGKIEKSAEQMKQDGWLFVDSTTDIDLRSINLKFEREIEN